MFKADTLLGHTVTGGLAGLVAESVTHPIDTVRTRLQNQRGNTGIYKGTFPTLWKIFHAEGIKGLYGGFATVASFTLPAHALYFSGYEVTKRFLQPSVPIEEKSAWVHFTSGIVADLFGAIIWTPQDILKQRFQILPPEKRTSVVYAIKEILREDGVRGLFRGFGAGIATYAPFVGIYFVVYEQSKQLTTKHFNLKSEKDIPFWNTLTFGGMAGAIAGALTCPLDVMKTRIQIQSSHSERAYSGIIDAFRTILREEGPRAFFKGLNARILWLAPSSAITIFAYEQFKKILLTD